MAAVSSCVLLFGVYETQSGFVPSVLSLARLGIYDLRRRVRVHSSGFVRCAASSYVLLFGVYEALESGPRGALHVTCFHIRHEVICPCGCLEDTRYSDLARSPSTNFHAPVCTRGPDTEVSGTGGHVASWIVFCAGDSSVAAVPTNVLVFAVYETLESDPRRALHVTYFICVTG